MSTKKILATKMQENDANAKTIKGYLKSLLCEVINEQEGFSGKRPFGNSGWFGELDEALVKGGWVEGELDEDGYIESVDSEKSHEIIIKCINSL